MKIKILLSLVLLMVGVVLFWLWRASPRPLAAGTVDNREGSTNASLNDASEPTPTPSFGKSEPRMPPGLDPKGWKELLKLQSHFAKQNGPVAYYAQALDQNQMPVAGVKLRLELGSFNEGAIWQKSVFKLTDADFNTSEKIDLVSDANGRFTLTGKRGTSMHVISVEKDGYLVDVPVEPGLLYNTTLVKALPFYADPTKGVTIHLWKKGATEPVIQVHRRVRLLENQTDYPINIFSAAQDGVAAPFADLVLKIPYATPEDQNHRLDRWVILGAPHGGILETGDAYPYAAPEKGYEPLWRKLFQPGGPRPDSEGWRRTFYLRAREGRAYVGLKVKFDPGSDAFEVDAIINPSGSRNLEPDPTKQITDPEAIRRLDEDTAKGLKP